MLKYCYEDFGADKFTGTNARSFAHLESRSFLMEREGEGRGRGGGGEGGGVRRQSLTSP